MFDSSNMPVAARAEDRQLIKAVRGAGRRYGFSDAAAKELLDAFTNPEPRLRKWIFELRDPAPRTNPFATSDHLAAFTRDVLTRGQDCSARWADLSPRERRLARRIERFAQNKRRGCIRAGRPQNVDWALVLYVIRRIEEAIGVPFRFARPKPFCVGGPMLRLAEAALLRLFHIADDTDPRRSRVLDYLGWVPPARHYTQWEIARTAQLARRASRTSPRSPANWPSDLILALRGDVRVELAGKARQKNKDQGSVSPSSWDTPREALKALVANPWVNLREALVDAAAASERQTPSGLDALQANLKSGVQPDLIELSKRRMRLVAEEIFPEPPTSLPPSDV
jgi:hypothetical protein